MTRDEIQQLDNDLREIDDNYWHERTQQMREEFDLENREMLGIGYYRRCVNPLDGLV